MANWAEQIEWDDLLDNILDEKCVLIVGPDLISFENKQTLFQMLCRQLVQDVRYKDHVDISPQYIFEHEELLQLKPGKSDTSLFRFFREFYQSRTEFDEPFAKIAQIPFHLVISLLPDQRLSATFGKMSREHQFSYFATTPPSQSADELEQDKTVIEKPTQRKPLIYNIIGTLHPPDSVITFDHLFNYLQNILGPKALPVQLAKALKEAKTFLFLGVHFERWYMQMLLRVFIPRDSANGKIPKYSLLQTDQANDVCTFIARRLELDFLPVGPLDFLNELYRKVDEKNLLVKTTKATVFLSYSHADSEPAMQLCNALKQANIAVVMDEESMKAGEKIRRFMQRVREVDAVVALVSENSLRSPWVGKEIMYSLKNDINLVPCFLDRRFLDPDVADAGQNMVRTKLREINRLISERRQEDPFDPVNDLTDEEELWRELGRNQAELIAEIKGRKGISLLPADRDTGIRQLLATLLS